MIHRRRKWAYTCPGRAPSGGRRLRVHPWCGSLLVVLSVAALGCGERTSLRPAPARLVVLYATCTLNKSFLSPYNEAVVYTPHLERFSREGQTFTKHRTEAGASGIAFASLFSGGQAPIHGAFNHPVKLHDSVELVTEAFGRRGYETFYWVRHSMAEAELGYAQGVPASNVIPRILKGDDPRFVRILERLRSDPGYKAFIVTAFTETHSPYRNRRNGFCARYPEECDLGDLSDADFDRYHQLFRDHRRRFSADLPAMVHRLGWSSTEVDEFAQVLDLLYRSNVEHLDRMFGDFVEGLRSAGLLDEALVAFTADHGEAMYEPNDFVSWAHGGSISAEVIDIPLIVRGPRQGVPPGRSEYVTRSMDTFPTLAGLAGLELGSDEKPQGRDLSDVIRNHSKPPELSAFSHNGVAKKEDLERHGDELGLKRDYFTGDLAEETWIALREGDSVLHYRKVSAREWRFFAYDAEEDPTEDRDYFDPNDDAHRAMAERLMVYRQKFVRGYSEWQARRGNPSGRSVDDIRRLRSLGYLP